jgi:DOMON domain
MVSLWYCSAPLLLLSTQLVAVASSADPSTFFGGTGNGAYLDWVASAGSKYPAFQFLPSDDTDSNDGIAIHWDIPSNDTKLHLAVAARATGFVGFGLADAGGMEGSDIMLFETSNPNTVRDCYVLTDRVPITDRDQHWILVDSVIQDGFLIVEAMRKLDTGDFQDHPILNDNLETVVATRVIGAWVRPFKESCV